MKLNSLLAAFAVILLLPACQKFLDAKPDQKMVVPATISDFQSILDNTTRLNRTSPIAPFLACDDIYITAADWKTRTTSQQNIYLWGKDVYNDNSSNDWTQSYMVVYYANNVLDYAGGVKGSDNVMGQAYFFRSFALWNLLQVFAAPYNKDSSTTGLGIPLRLNSDLNIPSVRAGLKECYTQVIADAVHAVQLLPLSQLYLTRPAKPAAYALLARVYLSVNDYSNALMYADSALQLNNKLIDFNTLNATASTPIAVSGPEVLFHSAIVGATPVLPSMAKIDSTLFRSYLLNDLRRTVFFKINKDSSYAFKGSYTGTTEDFNGLATDEMFLIRSECNARKGNTNAAMTDLNTLLVKRWKSGTFTAFTASDATDALTKVLTERRKELITRSLRWTDLRRLNKDPQFAVTITRIIDGKTYTLPPGDNRYVFHIPLNVITMTGMEQNP